MIYILVGFFVLEASFLLKKCSFIVRGGLCADLKGMTLLFQFGIARGIDSPNFRVGLAKDLIFAKTCLELLLTLKKEP